MPIALPTTFEPLKQQLLAAANAFADDAQPLHGILSGLVDDVERAVQGQLEIVPVCHHSPSSAVHMVRRLQARPPRVVYMECCEDLRPVLSGLRDCKLPVALQAFASVSDDFPPAWAPLNLVCPLTEFSAEFQAIAYCLENPKTELVFVDRSADHLFQWLPQEASAIDDVMPDELTGDDLDGDAGMHGTAVGVEIGSLVPSFEQFTQFLISNARVQHFSEWWDQYVEEAIIAADTATYRQVMLLIGSLFRRLGTRERDRESDELRERFMWTRIKQHLRSENIDPSDAIFICGAAHSASRVEEFGVESSVEWDIPPRTETAWLYGLLPSSYSAIEHQFSHPRGAVTLAEARWKKSLSQQKLRAFSIAPRVTKKKTAKKNAARKVTSEPIRATASPNAATVDDEHPLLGWLNKPPSMIEEDQADLLGNCVRIVDLARRNGYFASTADSIAVYQTSVLLANLRNRRHPTPYDFRDAAITCIEKDAVPKKRDVARLCDILLGGDKTGQIGYESLPPLAQDVHDRLAQLPVKLEARTIQRALLDFRKNPEYLPCSDLLWKLRYLLGGDILRPIMGQRELGHVPQQESWDIAIGKNQGAIIQLGYEGVTVEHVLERRLKKAAFGPESLTVTALTAAEDSILYLKSERLTEELGERAIELLVNEPDVKNARAIYSRISRLIHYYRSTEQGLPSWCERFVTTGYSHYSTLLPDAFANRGILPDDLAAMLQFIFTLESLALSLGCERSQLVIAVRQSQPEMHDFPKQALLWSAECVLQLRDLSSLRTHFDEVLDNELTVGSLPEYLSGFLLALSFTPLVSALTVELMSKTFERLPDQILMPWLPKLLMMLRPHAGTALPTLIKEAAASFPGSAAALEDWTPPWERTAQQKTTQRAAVSGGTTAGDPAVLELLHAQISTTDALARSLGLSTQWSGVPVISAAETIEAQPTHAAVEDAVPRLLADFPDSPVALSAMFPDQD